MNHNDNSYFYPQVKLDIEGVIASCWLWITSQYTTKDNMDKLGQPEVEKLDIYLKLSDQGLVEPFGILRDFEITITGIPTRINFEVIELILGSTSYPTLVGCPWEWKIKANISLYKDTLKIKGKGKKVTIPLIPSDGGPWEEPINDDPYVRRLYQIM